MSKIKEQKMLIMVTASNNNKFYEVKLFENDTIEFRYGRVGSKGVTKTKQGGQREFDKLVMSKKKKGYKETQILTSEGNSNVNLEEIVLSQIETDKESKDLIKHLIKQNIHNIVSSTNIKYSIEEGMFTTPLGPVTLSGLEEAESILQVIENIDDSNSDNFFIEQNIRYFSIIPTKIKNLRDYDKYMLNSKERIQEQKDIIKSLKDTLELMKTNVQDDNVEFERVFDTKVSLLRDKTEFDRIVNLFEKTKNSQHGYNTNSYKVQNIYCLNIKKDDENYKSDMDNQMELWHGTKVANLLSILKSGLLMPKESPGSVTGAMFGNGLYFAIQSTKSLNYCDGMYWNSARKQDKIYMFLADVALGNYQVPRSSTSSKPDKGYDSYWAKPRQSGVMNDEIIIFNNNQIKLKYILELGK